MLTRESCQTWMAAYELTATLHEDNLVGVALTTKGRGVEQTTARELRQGTPSAGKPAIIRLTLVMPLRPMPMCAYTAHIVRR